MSGAKRASRCRVPRLTQIMDTRARCNLQPRTIFFTHSFILFFDVWDHCFLMARMLFWLSRSGSLDGRRVEAGTWCLDLVRTACPGVLISRSTVDYESGSFGQRHLPDPRSRRWMTKSIKTATRSLAQVPAHANSIIRLDGAVDAIQLRFHDRTVSLFFPSNVL